MKFLKTTTLILALLPLLFASALSRAEKSQDFGDYVVHFNALPTAFLPPAVAKEYGLVRSKQRALLTVAVLKRTLGTASAPVKANVIATASNLNKQVKDIEVTEVDQQKAIYYLGSFRITNEETLDFSVDVKPHGSDETFNVKFRQQFFVE